MTETAKGHAELVETPRLTTYEMQVLLGTTVSGCNMPLDTAFSLKIAWIRLHALGLIDRADGLAIATEKGLALIARALSPIAAHGTFPPPIDETALYFAIKAFNEELAEPNKLMSTRRIVTAYLQALPAPIAHGAGAVTEAGGYIIGNGDGTKWRTLDQGLPVWTDNREKAIRYARRADAELAAEEDEDAWLIQPYAALRPEEAAGQGEADSAAIDRFAAAMKRKMNWERTERGRHGWNDPAVCSEAFLAEQLVAHLAKGNAGTFEDIANFAMMLHQRGADPKVLAAFATPRADAKVAGQGEADLPAHPEDFLYAALLRNHDYKRSRWIVVPEGQSLDFADDGGAARKWLLPHLGTEWHLFGFVSLATPCPEASAAPDIVERLQDAWVDFINANPDDLTSPEDLPDHALMTGQQFVDYAKFAVNEELRAELADAPDIVPVAWRFRFPGDDSWYFTTTESAATAPDTEKQPLYGPEALAALRAELVAVKRERDDARAANERDRTNIIKSYTALSDEFSRRRWLFTSRGSYEWDDTRYQQEFRDAIDAMRPLVEKFRPIGADRTNCPETQAEVDAARMDWKARAEAAEAELAAVMRKYEAAGSAAKRHAEGRKAAEAEVARLKDENKELVAGLEPFAMIADALKSYDIDDLDQARVPVGYLLRARSLTAAKGG